MVKGVSAGIGIWLGKAVIESWKVLDNGKINVRDNMYVNDRSINKFPISFEKVNGKMKVSCPYLLSVEEMPVECNELIFADCFFSAEFYVAAMKQKTCLENTVLEKYGIEKTKALLQEQFEGEKLRSIIEEYFPTIYREGRGNELLTNSNFKKF